MPSLTEALRQLDDEVRAVRDLDKPVTDAEELVNTVLSIVQCGLYPGLSPWNVFKLLERFDSPQCYGFALGKRLRFAVKTVALIAASFSQESDLLKARAFVRCTLNTGCLTSVLELLSCIGSDTRLCLLEDRSEVVHDLWEYLLSGGEENTDSSLRTSTVNKLLAPLISDGVSILRCIKGSPLEGGYHAFMGIISQVGGPRLSVFLEQVTAVPESSTFNLPMRRDEERKDDLFPVFISDVCYNLNKLDHTEEVVSPVAKKKIIKKVVVKKRVAKGEGNGQGEPSVGCAPHENKLVPQLASPILPSQTEHEAQDSSKEDVMLDRDAEKRFCDIVDRMRALLAESAILVAGDSNSTERLAPQFAEGIVTELSSIVCLASSVGAMLAETPQKIRTRIEESIQGQARDLAAELA